MKIAPARIRHTRTGFTIVELLIVIVVIAVLAAITIVGYNGIQTRSKKSVQDSDLASLQRVAQQFNIDNSHYPSGYTENAKLLKSANLYGATRSGAYNQRNFVICNDGNDYAIITMSYPGGSVAYSPGTIRKTWSSISGITTSKSTSWSTAASSICSDSDVDGSSFAVYASQVT